MTIQEIADLVNDISGGKITKIEANKILIPLLHHVPKEIKPSGHGIVVNKSNATKTFSMETRTAVPYPDEL